MLPERYRQLLTAFVDGELSPRQRRALNKLLKRSAEARALLERLQADSQELRALAPAPLQQDLSDSVLTLIAQRRIPPPKPRVATLPPTPAPAGAWWPLIAAAALLLAVGAGSYLFFAFSFEPARPAGSGAKDRPKPPAKEDGPEAPDSKEVAEKKPPERPAEKPPAPENPPMKGPAPLVKPDPRKPADDPLPSAPSADPITAPSADLFDLKKVDAALPSIVKLHQLDSDAKRQALLNEFKKAPAFRAELPCGNGTKALERLQAACKAEKVGLVVEKVAQERLKHTSSKTSYVLYFENLTPEELARLFQRLAAEDRMAEPQKQPEPQLDALVVTPLAQPDRDQLAKLLGVEAAALNPKAAENSTAKPAEPSGLVVSFHPVRPNAGAAEVKRFLDTRKAPRPGTLQLLLVLRSHE
jgi:hypothetical protein